MKRGKILFVAGIFHRISAAAPGLLLDKLVLEVGDHSYARDPCSREGAIEMTKQGDIIQALNLCA